MPKIFSQLAYKRDCKATNIWITWDLKSIKHSVKSEFGYIISGTQWIMCEDTKGEVFNSF